MNILGVDVGLSGAFALLDGDGKLIELQDAPTMKVGTRTQYYVLELWHLVDLWTSQYAEATHFAIEKQSPMPPTMKGKDGKQRSAGTTSSFALGRGEALWEMAAVASQQPYEFVHPQTWRKHFSLKPGKAASLQRAQQLFPNAPLRGPRGGAKDGRADALLIAEFMRRRLEGKA